MARKSKSTSSQLSLFETIDTINPSRHTTAHYYNKPNPVLTDVIVHKLKNYNLDSYLKDLSNLGLELTWSYICEYALKYGENRSFLTISNFGEMYEIGLAVKDKNLKKKSGQYYTPDDIASVMGQWLNECHQENLCDVACGTGQLILTYLSLIGEKKAKTLINAGKLYLYDFDHIALKICKTAIVLKYQIQNPLLIHDIYCDFLDAQVHLPEKCRVISNPPYAAIESIKPYWKLTTVLNDTKELYSAFMEKIFNEAESTVIITPFSFISARKFNSLRKEMCRIGNGFIVAFDNVPGNIFSGRKHGIFNTNTANSVRAAITVLHQSKVNKGFKVSPLIRFKNEERSKLLQSKVLKEFLPNTYQMMDEKNEAFRKVFKLLEPLYQQWINASSMMIKDVVSKLETPYFLDMPNTCRYYTTASTRKLSRGGSISFYVTDESTFDFVYCFINSSFAYWWWRIFEGGITYTSSLFNALPLPLAKLTAEDKIFFNQIRKEMTENESKYIIKKKNAGVAQENIKFPIKYRKMINDRILRILNSTIASSSLEIVHANSFFEGS